MKRSFALLFALILVSVVPLTAFAADGRVTYSGNSGSLIFAPGSDYSPTDLFPDFKSVMPGDEITQKITVKNEADNQVKVKIYLRSLGAEDGSEEFLSKLGLRVKTSDNNDMAYMFDAAADETAQLSDWVCLGTLYSGGTVNLDVILSVPVTLDNDYQDKIGYLDWEFRVEEYPVEPEDPKPPQTGDDSHIGLWIALAAGSIVMIVILSRIFWFPIFRKKRKDEK